MPKDHKATPNPRDVARRDWTSRCQVCGDELTLAQQTYPVKREYWQHRGNRKAAIRDGREPRIGGGI